MPSETARQIEELKRRLTALDLERSTIKSRIQALETTSSLDRGEAPASGMAAATAASPAATKVGLFRTLFRGREDVFPRRWENSKTGKAGYAPVCRNEWVRGVCAKPAVKCGECANQSFVPVTDDILAAHLKGRGFDGAPNFTIGVYPLLPNETCWFIAADFDKTTWMRDVAAFRDTARARGVPVAVERSRSGNGAHAWIFFSEPVAAVDARRLGALLLTATMERCPEIGFESYDRLFPSQDTIPAGGFGNLIALPLQNGPREKGASLFVDDNFRSHEDQWALLSSIRRLAQSEVTHLVADAASAGSILGVGLPATDDEMEPWTATPSRRRAEPPIDGQLPSSVEVVAGNRVYIDRSNLPPAVVNRLVRIAAFQNPDFYSAQAMRLQTYGKPRIISCAEILPGHIALPRGCLDEALELLRALGTSIELRDLRFDGDPLKTRFLGELTAEQEAAAGDILSHENGVLAAATAFGKTVVAVRIIAARARNTLVLVHRRQLLDQWVSRLRTFLDIDPNAIGVIHGGRKRPMGIVDVALMQSLVRRGVVSDLVANYGHIIIDECHHLPAVGFEAVAHEARARYVLGLSATTTRKDGHHPIIFMQCGPVRHRVDARRQAASRLIEHRAVFRRTTFRRCASEHQQRPAIQALYAELAADQSRNNLIFDDIVAALETGRSPLVITERKDHLYLLSERLSKFARNVVVLRGGMGARETRAAAERLSAIPDEDERVIIATGRYLGEGFDDARLDTLFLTLPISWRGTLAQYAGRLHRTYAAKRDVVIYDYFDADEPMLAKMAAKREAGYRSLGYTVAVGRAAGNQAVTAARATAGSAT